MNPTLKQAQFSDYHGHGWMFDKVFKRDRKGNFLDANGKIVAFDDPNLWNKTVHLKDIHLEKGMQCVDCHFVQDMHGTGKIYGDRRAAIEIQCKDCHGTSSEPATLVTSGPACGGSRSVGRARDAVRRAAVPEARRRRHSAQHGHRRAAVGRAAGRRHDRSAEPGVQPEGAARPHHSGGRRHVGRREVGQPRASRFARRLLHVPHVVDDELLRLSPGGEGEHEEADDPQRGRREPGVRVVQPGDSPHRRLHARHRRHGRGPQGRCRSARRARSR